ncbi:MAG: luxQ 1 [Armatimonadetes bacterium]|jgi:PAS domain S-box-containing protein|nr:luxQ 1 [Armatimonadota bacterium]
MTTACADFEEGGDRSSAAGAGRGIAVAPAARLARLARRLLSADAALVFTRTAEAWRLQAADGLPPDEAAAIARDLGRELGDHVVRPGDCWRFAGRPTSSAAAGSRDAAPGLRVAVLAVPVEARHGRVSRCCCVIQRAGRAWTAEEAELLQELVAFSGTAAESYGAESRQRRSADHDPSEVQLIETINRIGQTLSAELDLERLVQVITDAGTELSGAEFGAFFHNVTQAGARSYQLYTLSGVSRDAFSRFPMPRSTAIFRPTFEGEGVVRCDDVTRDPRYGQHAPYHGMPEGHLPVRSYLAVPVVSRSGEVFGGLFFGHSEAGIFTEQQERLVLAVAAHASIAIDNARLFRTARAAEDRFRDLVNGVEAIFWEADARTFRFTYVSDRAQSILGYPAAEWLSQPDFWLRLIHPQDRHWVPEFRLSETAAGHDHDSEYRAVSADGREVCVRDIVYVVKNEKGKPVQLRGVMLDISARAETRAALVEAKERLRVALKAGELGTWEWNIRTDDLCWSETLQRIHGLPPGSFLGKIDAFLNDMHPDDREGVLQSVHRALTEGTDHHAEYRIVLPDGSVRWVLGCGRVTRDSDGVPLRMNGVCTDITLRKQAELGA